MKLTDKNLLINSHFHRTKENLFVQFYHKFGCENRPFACYDLIVEPIFHNLVVKLAIYPVTFNFSIFLVRWP